MLELSGVLSARAPAASAGGEQQPGWTKLSEKAPTEEYDRPAVMPGAREEEALDYVHVMSLFLASSLWTLFMTAFPVMVDLPEDLYSKHYGWYVGNDIVRLLEPVVR